jgi:hypothetical protein
LANAHRIFRSGLLMAGFLALASCAVSAAQPPPNLAVLPFEIHDTSGETGPSRHDTMLAGLTRVVGERIATSGLYGVVTGDRVSAAVKAVNSGTFLRNCNGCELDIARRAGADAVMIGWIWKVSTLILTLHVEIKDVASGRTIYARVFDFRGDNEKAWQRAADYMVQTMPRPVARPQPQDLGQ